MTLADAYRRLPPRALALLHLRAVVRRARRYSRDGMRRLDPTHVSPARAAEPVGPLFGGLR